MIAPMTVVSRASEGTMHTVRYSADLCIAEGVLGLDAWLLRHEKDGRIPLARLDQKWVFEQYIYNGEFHEPGLPWRLLSVLPCYDLDRERVVYINPNIGWANLVRPGDSIELFMDNWNEVCGMFVVSRVARTMLQEVGQDEVDAWLPGADMDTLIRMVGGYFGVSLDLYSEVTLLRLRRINSLDRPYEPLLLPKPMGC